jgi:hypothetical protein
MDLMQHALWKKVVEFLYEDQGDLAPPEQFEFNPQYADACMGMEYDMEAAERYLSKLSLGELELFCNGDRDLDIGSMIRAGGEDAKKASDILEELYFLILEGER